MKKIIYLLVMLTPMFLSSCKPHEERVMDRLDKLAEKIQKEGAKWDADQWKDELEELEDIYYDMEDCEFTPQQLTALRRLEGKLTVIIMSEGAKKLGDDLISFMEGAGAFMKGYKEGAESMQNNQDEELKEYELNKDAELESAKTELEEYELLTDTGLEPVTAELEEENK